MKKALISLLVGLVLLVGGSGVNAEGRGGGGGGGGQDKKADEALEKAKARAAEKAKEAKARAEKAKEEAGKAAADKAKAEKAKGQEAAAETTGAENAEVVEDANAPIQDKAKGKAAEKGKPQEKGKPADKGKDKVEEQTKSAEKALGKEHQQQLAALRKQLTHEEQKHLSRKARLERIRQLAADAGNTETVARVDKLIQNEQERYDTKRKTMTDREQKILQAGGTLEEAAAKGKAKADQAKGKADQAKGKADAAKEKTEKAGEGAKDQAEKAAEEAEKAKEGAEKAGGE